MLGEVPACESRIFHLKYLIDGSDGREGSRREAECFVSDEGDSWGHHRS